jgi:hypothetical protein
VVAFLGGSAWQSHRTNLGGWHVGVAQIGAKDVSIQYEGWTYGSSGSVDAWIDQRGTWHDSGWPQCLDVAPGHRISVRFQARAVTVDERTWRPIVAIDCR